MTGDELKLLRNSRRVQAQQFADMLELGRTSLFRYEQMDVIPEWLRMAACYALGHVIIETVTIERTKKVVNAKPRQPLVGVEDVPTSAPAKVKGRLGKAPAVDTNNYWSED